MMHVAPCRVVALVALVAAQWQMMAVRAQTNEIWCGNCLSTGAEARTGCNVAEIEQCVCDIDAFCCQFHWDSACVALVDNYLCNFTCLDQEPEAVSCSNHEIPTWQYDPACCTEESPCPVNEGSCSSNDQCADDLVCGAPGVSCDPNVFPSDARCCVARPCNVAHFDSGGCDDPLIEECVCGIRPQCCASEWGSSCVAVYEGFCST